MMLRNGQRNALQKCAHACRQIQSWHKPQGASPSSLCCNGMYAVSRATIYPY